MDADIILEVEATEGIGIALFVRCAEIGTDEPVAIERVQGKPVDVDENRRKSADNGGDHQADRQPYLNCRPRQRSRRRSRLRLYFIDEGIAKKQQIERNRKRDNENGYEDRTGHGQYGIV